LRTRIALAELALDRPGKALETLQRLDASVYEQNRDVALNYRMAKAKAFLATGRLQEGVDCLNELLQWADRIRSALPSLEWRRDFYARYAHLYMAAIASYASVGDGVKAFELCEQAKARTFADQLMLSHAAQPAEAAAAREAIAKLKEQLQLLTRIGRSLAVETGDGAPYDLMVRLRTLDPGVQLVETDGANALRLSPERVEERRCIVADRIAALEEEAERDRLATAAATPGSVLDYLAVRSLLAAASPPQQRIVLLEYFIAAEFVLLFIGRGDLEQPQVRFIQCSRTALAEVVGPKMRRWSARHRRRSSEPKEAELGPFFLQFLAPALEGAPDREPLAAPGDLLWIVPHDLLHHVPFHAVAFEGKLLIERNPICYSPSSSVMKFCLERRTGRLESALVVGDTRGRVEEITRVVGASPVRLLEANSARGGATVWNDGPQSIHLGLTRAGTTTASRPIAPKSGFRTDRASESAVRCTEFWAVAKSGGQRVRVLDEEMLVQARAEACRIAELFKTAPLLDKAATKTRIMQELATSHYDVVHFACHAEYDARKPLDSAIWLAGDPLPGGDDPRPALLTAAEFVALRVPAQLVVLSACQTGLSDIAEGDEMTGLPRSLLAAGAASLVASLWAVDDISTILLMTRFYRNLLNDEPSAPTVFRTASALQEAQRYLRNLTVAEATALCRAEIRAAQGLPDADERIRPYEEMLQDLSGFEPAARRFEAYHFWAPFSLIGAWS
jgi:CHAT domain-containing protein